jgi:hypothetical protein
MVTCSDREEEINDTEVPILLTTMDALDKEIETNDELAAQFGCAVEMKGGAVQKRRRKAATV